MPSTAAITPDAVVARIRPWLLNPSVVVPLALGLRWEPVFARLLRLIAKKQAVGLRWWTSALAAANLVFAANRYLNKQVGNNWVADKGWDWDQEIVVVTGGSRGLGAAIVRRLIARNPRTRVVVIDFQPLQWTPPPKARLHVYQCDLSDASALAATCQRVRDDVGHPTVLFNNAGLVRGFTLLDTDPPSIDITMRTNLTAPFLMTREFLPDMVRRDHGHIVNTGSLSALMPPPKMIDYAATKAGLAALHEVQQTAP